MIETKGKGISKFELIVTEEEGSPRQTHISNQGFSDLEMIGLLEVASGYISKRLVDRFADIPVEDEE